MSTAEKFIRWYATKINETDLVMVRNKLLTIRSKNMNMYNFLVKEFQDDNKPSIENNDSNYQIVKSGDSYRAKPIKKPPPIKITIQTRMAFDSSVCTTNMAAQVNVPTYQTKMLEEKNIPYRDTNEDELKELELRTLQRCQSKIDDSNVPSTSKYNPMYTMMAGDENSPVVTRMTSLSNIPKNAHRLRFLKGENLNPR